MSTVAEVGSFLRNVVYVRNGENSGPEYYIAIKQGAKQSHAKQVGRVNPHDGRTVEGVATDVINRWTRLRSPHPLWVQIFRVGAKAPEDTMCLPPHDAAEEEEDDDDKLATTVNGALGVVVNGLVGMGQNAATREQALLQRISDLETLNDGLRKETITLAERAALAEATVLFEQEKVTFLEQHAGHDVTDALKEIVNSPIGKAVAVKLMQGKDGRKHAKKDGDKAPPAADQAPSDKTETPDERADRLLLEIKDLWATHPETLLDRPDRLMELQVLGEEIGQKFKAKGS